MPRWRGRSHQALESESRRGDMKRGSLSPSSLPPHAPPTVGQAVGYRSSRTLGHCFLTLQQSACESLAKSLSGSCKYSHENSQFVMIKAKQSNGGGLFHFMQEEAALGYSRSWAADGWGGGSHGREVSPCLGSDEQAMARVSRAQREAAQSTGFHQQGL